MQVTCWVPGQWEGRKKGIKWQRNDTNETFYVCEFGLLKLSGYNGINKGLVNRQQTGFIYCFKKVSCKQEVTYSLLVDVKTLQKLINPNKIYPSSSFAAFYFDLTGNQKANEDRDVINYP